ncbi:MAG: hypothetical protein K6A75_05660 [Ruminococcus sp.]|nr:hypothetical protein [Ruminococcus sp.]
MIYDASLVLAALLFLWLVLCDISEVQAIDERKTEERREKYRQLAYANVQKERTKKRNREELWRQCND